MSEVFSVGGAGTRRERGGGGVSSPAGRLLAAVIAVLALILAGELVFHLLLAPRLTLRNVVVTSDLSLAREQVLALAGLEAGARYFSVDPAEIRRRLEAYPAVARAEVRKVFPDTLHVSLQARRALAFLLFQDRDGRSLPLVVDRHGVVFQVGGEVSGWNLPLVSGVELVGAEVRAGLELPSSLRMVLEDLDRLGREAPELARLISELRLVPLAQERFELLLYPVAYRVRLRLGAHLDADSLRGALLILDLLERQNLTGRVEELDLRSRDVVYRIKEEG
jgi:cell division protein FtsQ